MDGQLGKNEARYFRYLRERIVEDPELLHPANHVSVFDGFLAQLRQANTGATPIVDVKYGHLFTVMDVGADRLFKSKVLEIAKSRYNHIFHMIRKNKLQLLISEAIANATNQWSIERKEEIVDFDPITIDVNKTIGAIVNEERLEQEVIMLLQGAHHLEHIYYEEMFDDANMFSEELIKKVKTQLGGSHEFVRAPKLVKQNYRSLASTIVNFDELGNKLSGTKYEWMLDDAK